MNKHLVSREGYTIGYWNRTQGDADYTPLSYIQRSNPKTATFPRGFRELLQVHCGQAWIQICNNGKVFGFRFRDIIEENYNKG